MDILNKQIVDIFEGILDAISKLATIPIFILAIMTTYFLNEIEIMKELILGILIITLFGAAIRYFLYKERPKKMSYSNFIEKIKASSFPSMHSARFSYLGLTLISIYFTLEFTLFLISIYLVVSYQRIYSKRHDIYDIIGGLILGICVFIFVSNLKGF